MTEENKNKQIVTFGKYKGKPIELLLRDQSYAKWLAGQDWFQQQHKSMYTLIIHNYHTEPIDTPEHNQMQVRFLDEMHALKLAYLVSNIKLFQYNNKHFKDIAPQFFSDLKEKDIDLSIIIKELNKLNGKKLLTISKIDFEQKGLDVRCSVYYGYSGIGVLEDTYRQARKVFDKFWENNTFIEMRVELKPSVGDDFPAVLRQMKASKANMLVIREYTGTGVTFDEFKQFFVSQGVRVFIEKDINQVTLPEYDEHFEFSENLFHVNKET